MIETAAMASRISAWRKAHKLTRDDALLVLGLSLGGYNKQLSGDRDISRQTQRLMADWERFTIEQRHDALAELRKERDRTVADDGR